VNYCKNKVILSIRSFAFEEQITDNSVQMFFKVTCGSPQT